MIEPNDTAAIIAASASLFTALGILLNAIVSFMNLLQSRANHVVAKRVEVSVNGRVTEMKALYEDREEARVTAATVTGELKATEALVGVVISDGITKNPLQKPSDPV